ncbi:MAG: hypothetical protein DRI44_02125 [Chlamydiae bacterium]|nr:MAG: hypothetical protein DRI44_02125 [Chlamydiota bacterium]
MYLYKKFQPVICVLLCISILLATSGCSVFRPWNETINVSSYPEDANITVNGLRYKTPAQISLRRNESIAIQCYKKGYLPYNKVIKSELNATGILDVAGTFLFIFPCIGLLTPGAFSFEETNINMSLYDEN